MPRWGSKDIDEGPVRSWVGLHCQLLKGMWWLEQDLWDPIDNEINRLMGLIRMAALIPKLPTGLRNA